MVQLHDTKLRILIADDDSDDHYFITEAIKQENKDAQIVSVYDGQELVNYLLKKGEHCNCKDELPHFALVDINMPKLTGLEALKELKKHSVLENIKFFVLSTSQSYEDIRESFAIGVDGFYTKPNRIERLKLIVKQIIWRYPIFPGA